MDTKQFVYLKLLLILFILFILACFRTRSHPRATRLILYSRGSYALPLALWWSASRAIVPFCTFDHLFFIPVTFTHQRGGNLPASIVPMRTSLLFILRDGRQCLALSDLPWKNSSLAIIFVLRARPKAVHSIMSSKQRSATQSSLIQPNPQSSVYPGSLCFTTTGRGPC